MRRSKAKVEPAKVQPTQDIRDEIACDSPKAKKRKKNKIKKQDPNLEDDSSTSNVKLETVKEMLSDTNYSFKESGENEDIHKKRKNKKKMKEEIRDDIPPLEDEIKVNKINGVLETNNNMNFHKSESDYSSRLWPKEELDRLINQIEAVLPNNDNLKYTSRLTKLDWKTISFDEHPPEECQEMWRLIQAKVRCYRILKEILGDAREYINNDDFLAQNDDRPKKPAKPLTSFMLYYHDTKNDILKKNPGINVTEISKKVSEMWKSLSPKKLEKYKNRAAELRQKYEEELKTFYQEHPELAQEIAAKKNKSKPNELGFSKPKSAFQLFHQAMREKHPNSGAGELLEKCKRKWKNLSEKKKVIWIEAAQQEEASYKENLKKYESEHPGYVAPPMKTLITKRDKHILNNLSGKPKKPASNAYSLYSQESLQNGSLKDIPSKDRLAEISRRWKALTQKERDAYVIRCEQLQKEYKIEYQKYLDTLPPERKLEELEKMQPKRKKNDSKGSQVKKLKISEPIQPPVNEFELFKQKHESEWNKNSLIPVNDDQARAKWKKISKNEKEKYSEELKKLKNNYIVELTEYIKHCPPNKLAHYVALIASQQQQQPVGAEQISVSSECSDPGSDSE